MTDGIAIWLRHSGSTLETFYRKSAAGAPPWPTDLGASHSPDARALARAAWLDHMRNEYRTSIQMARYQWLMLVAGVPVDLSGCVGRIVADEIRHADLCAGMLHALGGPVQTALTPGEHELPGDPARPLFDQIHDFTILGVACGESLSARLLAAAARDADAGPCREVLRSIQRDEAFHAEFGWHASELFAAGASAETRQALESMLPAYFRNLERHCTVSGPLPDVPDARGLGVVRPADHLEAFYACIDEELVPRLTALGLDARAAWEARMTAAEPA